MILFIIFLSFNNKGFLEITLILSKSESSINNFSKSPPIRPVAPKIVISSNFKKLKLKINRKIDKIIGGSKIGPHKSDYLFYINNNYLASQLSTGQQKTLILLTFLSQCKYLIDIFNQKPILLLDEICSHLDEVNREILLNLVESFDLQIFMTGTLILEMKKLELQR